MHRELENEILSRWPDWFRSLPDVTRSSMAFGFQHGDGWFALLKDLLEQIEPEVAAFNRDLARLGTQFEIVEIKEKFGELRITAAPTNEAIFTAFLDARERSRTVCELCGGPGRVRDDDGWNRVRCDECHSRN